MFQDIGIWEGVSSSPLWIGRPKNLESFSSEIVHSGALSEYNNLQQPEDKLRCGLRSQMTSNFLLVKLVLLHMDNFPISFEPLLPTVVGLLLRCILN